MKLSQTMILPLLVALVIVIYAAVPAAANITPPANNCCTMYHRCIKSSLCTTLDCVCSSDVEEDLFLRVDAKPPANNCCTMNNQCVKSELCKELDCVCSSPVDEGKMKVKDGKVAFMSPRNVERLTVERNGMVKKGMRVTEH